jgi:hypothetical protein
MRIAFEPDEAMGGRAKLNAIRGDQVGWGGVDQRGLAFAPTTPFGRTTDLPANSVNRVENRFTRRRQGQGDPFRIRAPRGK